MRLEERIDAWLADEMSTQDRIALEHDLAHGPELREMLAEQAALHEALGVGLGDQSEDQRIVNSVIAALQARDTDEVSAAVIREVATEKKSRNKRIKRKRSHTRSGRPLVRERTRRTGVYLFLAVAAAATLVIGLVFKASSKPVHTEVVCVQGTDANVRPGSLVFPGDTLTTGPSGSVTVRSADDTRITISSNTRLTLESDGTEKHFYVAAGLISADVQPQEQPLLVRTPHGTATVLGTTFTLRVSATMTRLDVQEGKVSLTSHRGTTVVVAGQFAIAAIPSQKSSSDKPALQTKEALLALYRFDEGGGDRIKDHAPAAGNNELRIGMPGNVQWLPTGIRLDRPADIISRAPLTQIVQACQESNEITVEAWIRSTRINPSTTSIGMDRIVTISADSRNRNLSIGQGEMRSPDSSISVRCRVASGSEQKNNGLPAMVTKGLASITKSVLMHVVFVRRQDGAAAIWINGVQTSREKLNGSLEHWNPSYRLALFQEVKASPPGEQVPPEIRQGVTKRFWKGEIHHLAIYSRALTPKEIRAAARNGVR